MNITIVTVHLDDFAGLKRTFQSLQTLLTRSRVMWVVIDGGSLIETEDQKVCLEQVESAATFFSSEPDHGIYDAMNKGSLAANGDYVLYLSLVLLLACSYSTPFTFKRSACKGSSFIQ